MASQLKGLRRKLAWSDFTGQQPSSNPNNMKAKTDVSISVSGVMTLPIGTGKSQTWQLADTLVVEVVFDSSKSWKLPSIDGLPLADKNKLLNHEQGHYDITALLARDMFLALMQLKGVRLSSSATVATEVQAIHKRFADAAQPVQNAYDSDGQTKHGDKPQEQSQWDGFIQTAFTQERNPAMVAPDGAMYKVELLDVLAKNSIVI